MNAASKVASTEILRARQQIDRLDQKIASLCAERVKKAEFILKNKSKHNISKIDKQRELKIFQSYLKKIKSGYADVSAKSVQDFVRSLMRMAPHYNKSDLIKGRFYGSTTSSIELRTKKRA